MTQKETQNDFYTIEYSESKNRHLMFKFIFYPLIIISIFLIIADLIFDGNESGSFIVFAISLFSVALVFGLIFTLPTYLVIRKYFSDSKMIIKGDEIVFSNEKKNVSVKFFIGDIKRYTLITYSSTIYKAMQLDIPEGRKISISNSMRNYELLENKLNSLERLPRHRKFIPIGLRIENIY